MIGRDASHEDHTPAVGESTSLEASTLSAWGVKVDRITSEDKSLD